MPDASIGVVVPGVGGTTSTEETQKMATTSSVASEAFGVVMEQRFFEVSSQASHERVRLSGMRDNVAEQTELGYLTEQRVVGVREAKASSMLQPVYGQPVPVQKGTTNAAV